MQTIERTALSELITNEDYARKVLPHMKRDYFSDRSERIVFTEIQYIRSSKKKEGFYVFSFSIICRCRLGTIHRFTQDMPWL